MAQSDHPVNAVKWIPIEKVVANSWNMNSVAKNEMQLLYTSISHDGFTQPIVTIYDSEKDIYVIIDGFHRFSTARCSPDILASTDGCVPCVVIDKPINDRMASTVRHNRARGKHAITGMSNVVFKMLAEGWEDEQICKELGLEADELIRLKYVTGFAKLFESVEYRQAWVTKKQILAQKAYEKGEQDA